MTIETAKRAMRAKAPVDYDGTRYRRIVELILWIDKDTDLMTYSAILESAYGNFTMRARLDSINLASPII